MGLFSGLSGKKDNKPENVHIVIGFLIDEIESTYTNKMSVEELDEVILSSYTQIKPFLESMDKTMLQELANTLYSVSPEKYELLSTCSIALCWNRLLSVMNNEKHKHLVEEDALNTLNTLLAVIHEEIKQLITANFTHRPQ